MATDLAHPDTSYDVRPYDQDAPPELAAGHAGIAMCTRRPPRLASRGGLGKPTVLVDGKPAMSGWGTAQIGVPPGERLVEVRQNRAPDGITVRITEGEVVGLEYVPSPARFVAARLGRMSRRSTRVRFYLTLLASLSFAGFAGAVIFLLMGSMGGLGFFAAFAAIAAGVAVGLGLATRSQ